MSGHVLGETHKRVVYDKPELENSDILWRFKYMCISGETIQMTGTSYGPENCNILCRIQKTSHKALILRRYIDTG
jgi:hypothetical protein